MHVRSAVLCTIALFVGCSGNDPAPDPSAAETAAAPVPSTAVFTTHDGGGIRTNLGYGIVLNDKSALSREWVVADDTIMPLRFVKPVGIRTIYDPGGRYTSGSYYYTADIELQATEPLSAFEVRFVLFDVWGEFVRTLSATEIEEITAASSVTYKPRWNLFSENEASEYYASIAYIARVRTASGKVVQADPRPIVDEAKRFSSQFAPELLDPSHRQPVDSSRVATSGFRDQEAS
jgi:hypothetical protein